MHAGQRFGFLGLTLSQNKSVVVASHTQLVRAVRRGLLEQGLSFEGAPSVRDVGLDANAGHGRSVKIQNKREQKCRKRNAHIKVIQNGLKSKHQRMKLFKTGILPAVTYGHAGMGMCPSSIQLKRVMAADSCGKRIKTACTTTILHFHFGENRDPSIWFPLDQHRTWLEIQSEEMGHRQEKIDVARAWAAAAASMRKKSRWNMVWGPMTATMATLHDLSIIPVSPWKWYPAENPDVGWTYSGGDPGPFLSEMQQRLSRKVWEQAALHYHGFGAEDGVDMTNLHKHHKQLVARGAHVRAGMLYKLPQHRSMTVQESVSTTPTPKLLVPFAGHLMTQCFIAFTIVRASLHPSSWTKRIGLSMKRERKPTPVPSSGSVVSRRVPAA